MNFLDADAEKPINPADSSKLSQLLDMYIDYTSENSNTDNINPLESNVEMPETDENILSSSDWMQTSETLDFSEMLQNYESDDNVFFYPNQLIDNPADADLMSVIHDEPQNMAIDNNPVAQNLGDYGSINDLSQNENIEIDGNMAEQCPLYTISDPEGSSTSINIFQYNDQYYAIGENGILHNVLCDDSANILPFKMENNNNLSSSTIDMINQDPQDINNNIIINDSQYSDNSNKPIYMNINLTENALTSPVVGTMHGLNNDTSVDVNQNCDKYIEYLNDRSEIVRINCIEPETVENPILDSIDPSNLPNIMVDEYGQYKIVNSLVSTTMNVDNKDINNNSNGMNTPSLFYTTNDQGELVLAMSHNPLSTETMPIVPDCPAEEELDEDGSYMEEPKVYIIPTITYNNLKKTRKQNLKIIVKDDEFSEMHEDIYYSDQEADTEITIAARGTSGQNKDWNVEKPDALKNEAVAEKQYQPGTPKRPMLLKKRSIKYVEDTDEDDSTSDESYKQSGTLKCNGCNKFFITSRSLIIHKKQCKFNSEVEKNNKEEDDCNFFLEGKISSNDSAKVLPTPPAKITKKPNRSDFKFQTLNVFRKSPENLKSTTVDNSRITIINRENTSEMFNEIPSITESTSSKDSNEMDEMTECTCEKCGDLFNNIEQLFEHQKIH